jgi:hypothetical protein
MSFAWHLGAAETLISDSKLHFSITIPNGFEAATDASKTMKCDYAFTRPPRSNEKLPTGIAILGLSGTIGRNIPSQVKTPTGDPCEIQQYSWHTMDITAAACPETVHGIQCVNLNAVVPLAPQAIRLTVFGEVSNRPELEGILRSILSTLEGRSNWLTAEERYDRLASLLGALFGGGLVAWYYLRKKNKKVPPAPI